MHNHHHHCFCNRCTCLVAEGSRHEGCIRVRRGPTQPGSGCVLRDSIRRDPTDESKRLEQSIGIRQCGRGERSSHTRVCGCYGFDDVVSSDALRRAKIDQRPPRTLKLCAAKFRSKGLLPANERASGGTQSLETKTVKEYGTNNDSTTMRRGVTRWKASVLHKARQVLQGVHYQTEDCCMTGTQHVSLSSLERIKPAWWASCNTQTEARHRLAAYPGQGIEGQHQGHNREDPFGSPCRPVRTCRVRRWHRFSLAPRRHSDPASCLLIEDDGQRRSTQTILCRRGCRCARLRLGDTTAGRVSMTKARRCDG